MSIFNLKTAALAIVAGVGLSGCAYGPYGGLGVGVGYGNGYNDPYYNSGGYYSGRLRLSVRVGSVTALRISVRLRLSAIPTATARPTTAGTTATIIRAPAITCTTVIGGRIAGATRSAAIGNGSAVSRPSSGGAVRGHRELGRLPERPQTSATVRQRGVDRRQRIIRERPVASSPQVRTEQQVQTSVQQERRAARAEARQERVAHAARTAARPRTKKQPGRRPPLRLSLVGDQPSAGRRRISTIDVNRITGTSSWLVTVVSVRKEPISGLERDGVFSMILPFTWSVSPG